MKIKLAFPLGALGLACTVCGAWVQEPSAVEAVLSGGKYTSSDGMWVEYIGGCSPSVEKISCWDAKGQYSADLSERVAAPYLVEPSREITLKFGKKNRLLLFRHPNQMSISYKRSSQDYVRMENINLGDDYQTDLVEVAASPDESDTAVHLTLTSYTSNPSVKLPMKVSATGEVNGKKFILRGFRGLTKAEQKMASVQNVGIRSHIDLWDATSNAPVLTNIGFLDLSGLPVMQLEKEGRPKKMAPGNVNYGNWMRSPEYLSIMPADATFGAGLMTNVDLNYVGSVVITLVPTHTVRFEKLPLDALP